MWDVAFSRVCDHAIAEAQIAEPDRKSLLKYLQLADVVILADQDVQTQTLAKMFQAESFCFTQDKPVRIKYLDATKCCNNNAADHVTEAELTQNPGVEVRGHFHPISPTFCCTIMPRVATVQTRPEQMKFSELRRLVRTEVEQATAQDNATRSPSTARVPLLIIALVEPNYLQSATVGLLQEVFADRQETTKKVPVVFLSAKTADAMMSGSSPAPDSSSSSSSLPEQPLDLDGACASMCMTWREVFATIGQTIAYRFLPEFKQCLEKEKETIANLSVPKRTLQSLVAQFSAPWNNDGNWMRRVTNQTAVDWNAMYSELQILTIDALEDIPHYREFRKRFSCRVRRIFDDNWNKVEQHLCIVGASLARGASLLLQSATFFSPPTTKNASRNLDWVGFLATTLNVLLPVLLSNESFADLDPSHDYEQRLRQIDATLQALRK